MSPIIIAISPELLEAAAAYTEAVERLEGRTQKTRADIKAILEEQYWTQAEAGAVGASLPLVDDCDDEGEWVSYL